MSLLPIDLRCEHLISPLIVHGSKPMLSWRLEAENPAIRNQRQSAWQILAATREDVLRRDTGDLWDSKRVNSADIRVAFGGEALSSRQACFWKVRVWDEGGEPSAWSEIARFEAGLLEPGDWKGKWIESPDTSCRSPLFRKSFALDAVPKIARVYTCGLGYHELYINGTRIGDHVLEPAQTDYLKRVLYVGHDVTPLIRKGENVIGIMLGSGFFAQDRVWGGMSYGRPRLICQLHCDDAPPIISDARWQTISGPVLENNVYAGEVYDARREIAGWSTPGGSIPGWTAAEEIADFSPAIEPQLMPPIRRIKTMKPAGIVKVADAHVVDFGQNFAGWCRLKLSVPRGTKIQLRSSEAHHADGSVDTASTGVFATGVEQIDTYIAKGDAIEIWEPRFTYHGFRYVEVKGLPAPPTSETITGVVVHSDLPRIGEFECSDPILNRIYETAIWTLLSNVHGIPTDCPAREKCGWLGDAQITSELSLMNFDAGSFYAKYVRDIETSYTGNTPGDVAPGKRGTDPNGHLDWGLAIILVPWHIYLYGGDARVLHDHYESMRKFLLAAEATAKDGILSRGYGDWCPPGSVEPTQTPAALTTTAWFAHAGRIMSRIAKRLGHADDASHFDKFTRTTLEAFHRTFYQPDKKGYGSQCADAMSLELGLCPSMLVDAVAASLHRDVMETHHAHQTTGIFGSRFLYPALARNSYGNAALAVLRQTTYPSIRHLFSLGATTFWECWGEKALDVKWGARSQNHPMQAAFAVWFHFGLAGINPSPDHPGFEHVVLRPMVIDDPSLSWVSATHHSPRGPILSRWKNDGGRIDWHVELPTNVTATVHLPGRDDDEMSESGRRVPRSLDIGSGVYDFAVLQRSKN